MYCVNSQSDSFGRWILTYSFRVDLLWSHYYFCVKMRLKASTPVGFHVALVCSRRLTSYETVSQIPCFSATTGKEQTPCIAAGEDFAWRSACFMCHQALESFWMFFLQFWMGHWDLGWPFREGQTRCNETACCPRQPRPSWQELVGCPVTPGWTPASHKVLLLLGSLFKKSFTIAWFTWVLLMLDKLTLGGHQGNFQ